MKIKLLLLAMLLTFSSVKLHAQSQGELEIALSAHIRHAMAMIGNDDLKTTPLFSEFNIAGEDDKLVMYKWNQDKEVYISFSNKENKVVQSVIVSVPNRYAAMIKDFLSYHRLWLQSSSGMDGYEEYYNEDNTAFLRSPDGGQTLSLIIISNYFR